MLLNYPTETRTYILPTESTSGSSGDNIWIFGKNKDTTESKLSLRSWIFNYLQNQHRGNQASRTISTYNDQISNWLIESLSIGSQIEEDFLYDYNYHISPTKIKTLVGTFEFVGKGKTKFHFDIE
jgi:hypothetical protein